MVDILEFVAVQLEAPKSNQLPLLRTLGARGYLTQGTLGEYRLGRRAIELGLGSSAHRGLPDIARPALRALMQRTREPCFSAG